MGTILIIEDDEQNHILLDQLIKSMGHTPLHARDGQQGLEMADEYRPNLILLDLRLPIRNGWDVASILKKDDVLGHIPIVAVSVKVEKADESRAFEAGVDDFIEKPYPIQLMRDCINHYVQ